MYCKLVFPPEEIFKLSCFPKCYEELIAAVNARLDISLINKFTLKYMDSEKELVNICCDEDLETAILSLEAENLKGLKVHVLPEQKEESLKSCENRSFEGNKKLEVKTNDLNNSSFSTDSTKETKSAEKESTLCCECTQEIINIKYVCPECPNYMSCSECEEKADHAHALLKVRVSTGRKSQYSIGNLSYSTRLRISEKKIQEINEKSNMKRVSIMKNNSALATTTTNTKRLSFCGRIFLENESGSLVNVKSEETFEILVTVKNTGKESWPTNVRLVCVNGAFRTASTKLMPLSAGCRQHIHISLKAPAKAGKYLSQWRIYYQDEEKSKSFGESLFFDTQVKEENKINSRISTYKLRSTNIISEKASTPMPENGEKKLLNVNNIKIALYLNEIFPGLLQEKIEFLNNLTEVNENNIINIVEQYLLHSIKNQKKSMDSSELNIKQCQEVLVPSS